MANLLVPLITFPYLLRTLGVEQFGIYGFCQAVLAYALIIVDYGFDLSATQLVAKAQQHRPAISRIFWSVQTAKLLIILVMVPVLLCMAWTIPQFNTMTPVLYASIPVLLGSLLFPQWFFLGLERMGGISICLLAAKLLTIPLILWAVKSTEDTWRAAFIQSSASAIAGFFACTVIWRNRWIDWMPPTRLDILQVFKDGWHVFSAAASISLYTTAPTLILGVIASPFDVGIFSAADKIRQAAQSLMAPLGQAIYPRINAVMAQNTKAGIAMVRQLFLWQAPITLVLSFCIWWFAPWLVDFIMGPQYLSAISVLRMLAPLIFLIGLSNIFGIQIMLPLGLKVPFSRVVMISGLVNVGLIIVLGAYFKSDGVAAAILIVEVCVTLTMWWILRNADIQLFSFWKVKHGA